MNTTRQTLLHLLLAWVTPNTLAEERALHFNLPPQSLGAALDSLAQQGRLQMIYDPDTVGSRSSRALAGTYTPREAVEKLLAGTGLSHTFTAEDTVSVKSVQREATPKPANEPASKAEGTTVLPEMTVTASPRDDTSYNVPNATTATKTDTPIMETPVSIQVVPREVLEDQQVIRLNDALKNVSSFQPGFGFTLSQDHFILRGFELGFDIGALTYRDGVRLSGYSAITAGLERIEVLKGPASVLYGRIEPGGLINLVTKKPLPSPYYALQQIFGFL